MLAPFALISEDAQNYLISFHVVREAFRRGELPPQELMDFLYEWREAGLLSEAYAEEARHSEKNLERIIQLAVSAVSRDTKSRTKKTVLTADGEKEADSYEHGHTSNIYYILKRIKEEADFWLKSIATINDQSETGAFDQKGFRIIVESPKAREFRSRRGFEDLSKEEKERFKALFHGLKFSELSSHEKEKFYKAFTVEYMGLTDGEKRKYKANFQESHRKMCLDLASRIARARMYDTIPINPHYMRLDNLEMRVQRQVIGDPNGKMLLEFEYLLNRGKGSDIGFYETLLHLLQKASQQVLSKNGRTAEYIDLAGRKAYLVNLGNLVVNFHFYESSDSFSGLDIENLSEIIDKRYRTALKRFSDKDMGKRETRIMEYTRIGMENIPLGLFIFPETTTTDLMSKYPDMKFDESHTFDTFIKDRIGPNAESNGYENLKLFLSFNSTTKEISGECQIRDTIMDYDAEFGVASKFRTVEGHISEKIRRSKRGVAVISDKDIEFGNAFFLSGEENNQMFSRIYSDFYARSILEIAEEIAKIEVITKEQKKFKDLFERIICLYAEAKDRVNPNDFELVSSSINSVFVKYVRERGIGILSYHDSLWEINEKFRKVADLGAKLNVFAAITDLDEVMHRRHIDMLYNSFIQMSASASEHNAVTSLALETLIMNYNKRYGNHVPTSVQNAYRQRMQEFFESAGWRLLKFGGKNVGHLPHKLHKNMSPQKTRQLISEGGIDVSAESPLMQFDAETIGNMERIYRIFQGYLKK